MPGKLNQFERRLRKKKRRKKMRKVMVYMAAGAVILFAADKIYNYILQDLIEKDQNQALEQTNSSEEEEPVNKSINNWNLLLINQTNELSPSYQIELAEIEPGVVVDRRIQNKLEAMLADAKEGKMNLIIKSAYKFPPNSAEALTDEHYTGLAVDLAAEGYQWLDQAQSDRAEQVWLVNNCWKYGFIKRYPDNKSTITGVLNEPWHYRYVGVEAAKEIMEKGLCLEEYLQAR